MPHVIVEPVLTDEEIEAVGALLGVAWGNDDFGPAIDLSWFDLLIGDCSGAVALLTRKDGSDRIVAYGELGQRPPRSPDSSHGSGSSDLSGWTVKYVAEAPAAETAADLLTRALSEIEEHGGGHLHVWVREPTAAESELLRGCGLFEERELLQMSRPLPYETVPAATEEFIVREFRPDVDEECFLELNNIAFSGHPEQGGWELASLKAREAEPWFDPSGLLLYEVHGRLLASCWTKIQPDDRTVGEIYVVAVHPAVQGKGVGRKITVAALDYLAEVGCSKAVLYVDRANKAALSLYEALGFVRRHSDHAYTMTLGPAQ